MSDRFLHHKQCRDSNYLIHDLASPTINACCEGLNYMKLFKELVVKSNELDPSCTKNRYLTTKQLCSKLEVIEKYKKKMLN